MKFDKRLSPIKVAVFPVVEKQTRTGGQGARVSMKLCAPDFMCEFDDSGNIGKRYRRQDEIGTPYCVTVDFDSLEKGDVTVRDRDTMAQNRVNINLLADYIGRGVAKN